MWVCTNISDWFILNLDYWNSSVSPKNAKRVDSLFAREWINKIYYIPAFQFYKTGRSLAPRSAGCCLLQQVFLMCYLHDLCYLLFYCYLRIFLKKKISNRPFKKKNLTKLNGQGGRGIPPQKILVLLSASVKRFSVSRTRDFCSHREKTRDLDFSYPPWGTLEVSSDIKLGHVLSSWTSHNHSFRISGQKIPQS